MHNSFSCAFISNIYMFRAAMCHSSGELIVSIWYLVYVTLYTWPFGVQVWMRPRLIQTCTPNGHLYTVTYTRYCIDTINSPDNRHMAARNIYRIEINTHEKELCVKLVIYKDYTRTMQYKLCYIVLWQWCSMLNINDMILNYFHRHCK
jgi:hypothetical protein